MIDILGFMFSSLYPEVWWGNLELYHLGMNEHYWGNKNSHSREIATLVSMSKTVF
jgi:hypothetical protein